MKFPFCLTITVFFCGVFFSSLAWATSSRKSTSGPCAGIRIEFKEILPWEGFIDHISLGLFRPSEDDELIQDAYRELVRLGWIDHRLQRLLDQRLGSTDRDQKQGLEEKRKLLLEEVYLKKRFNHPSGPEHRMHGNFFEMHALCSAWKRQNLRHMTLVCSMKRTDGIPRRDQYLATHHWLDAQCFFSRLPANQSSHLRAFQKNTWNTPQRDWESYNEAHGVDPIGNPTYRREIYFKLIESAVRRISLETHNRRPDAKPTTVPSKPPRPTQHQSIRPTS